MNESTIFGVSARGILALLITLSCCAVAVWLKDLGVLKDLAFLVLGFYFGQKPTQGGSNASTSTDLNAASVTAISQSPDKPANPNAG